MPKNAMSSSVYFAPARAKRWDFGAGQIAGLERLVERTGLGSQAYELIEV